MLNKKIETELNKQVNAELYSAYFYLSMSAYLESINLSGFAHWMRIQAEEEQFHAMKIFDFINERGGRITLTEIRKPKTEWENVISVAEEIYEHEQIVTNLINNIVDVAIEEKDHATNNFLQWFVAEQVEEESNSENLLNQLKMFDGKGHGLFMLDKELSNRTFVPPTTGE
ncbi:MAG: ferritin [Bacteroidetes bacterium]|nr:ferritin [Bacteroidota bacterium]